MKRPMIEGLEFKPHPAASRHGAWQARHYVDENTYVSVVGAPQGAGFYCGDGTYEVAVVHNDRGIFNGNVEEPIGWLTDREVIAFIVEVQCR